MTAQLVARGPSISEEEANNLPSRTLAPSLLVVHDAIRGRQDQVAELPRWQDVACELHDASQIDIEARRDDTALVDAADQVHDKLASPVVIYDLHVAEVPVLLHHLEKLDDHLRTRADEDLPLAALLRIQDAVEAITEDADAHHGQRGGLKCEGSAETPSQWLE